MTPSTHSAAANPLPIFITAPDSTDVLLVIAVITVVGFVLLAGVLFLRLHSLPERMAHKTQKLQFEIVAVLCLLALLTHVHLFWVAALLLAFIDIPDFATPLNRIAGATETLAGAPEPADRRSEAAATEPGA
ncbi:MAG TPA: hypothetical protein VLA00_00315 [Xanthobacteraceae bacterium]|nr:hypothetical protein [Xanthobacteraceae bacterium]